MLLLLRFRAGDEEFLEFLLLSIAGLLCVSESFFFGVLTVELNLTSAWLVEMLWTALLVLFFLRRSFLARLAVPD